MSELTLLLDKRDILLRELRAMENRVAGLDMAIRILAEADASGTEARQRQDRGTELGPKGDGPTVSDNEPGRPKDRA